MDFYIKNMKEILEAINNLINNNINTINTKKVRAFHHIKPSNRSKVNFIWRALQRLEKEGILAKIGKNTPVNYRILSKNGIDIDGFIENIVRVKT